MTSETVLLQPLRATLEQLRSGELASASLVDALLRRIHATEPVLKAYTTVGEERMRHEAQAADDDLSRGRVRGPLHGLPIAIKDLIDTAGLRTTYGSSLYSDHVPERDATVVTRLREAGAVIAGKTNTHEFAVGCITPPTRNPFDPSRIPGGSSGGSAAAVGAGSALAALGSDSGGSIRIPASFCGVVGIKPTYGLVSRTGVFTESWSVDHIGPIARRVEDAALLLDVLAGHDPADATSVPLSRPSLTATLDGGLEGLRVGVPSNHFFDGLTGEVERSVRDAIGHLESAGAEIRELEFPSIDEILGAFLTIDTAEIAANHRRTYEKHADSYMASSRLFIESGLFIPATTYIDALRARPLLLNRVLEAMSDVDLLAVPTEPMVAPAVGQEVASIDGAEEDLLWAMTKLVMPFNLLGMPAVSVCCGYGELGLPIGLQLVGKPFAEPTVLRAAHAYEDSTPWLDQLLTRAA